MTWRKGDSARLESGFVFGDVFGDVFGEYEDLGELIWLCQERMHELSTRIHTGSEECRG